MKRASIIVWSLWLVYFVASEAAALLARAHGDTFSEYFWSFSSVPAVYWAAFCLWAWLGFHLFADRRRNRMKEFS
jgi:hypothetical protein